MDVSHTYFVQFLDQTQQLKIPIYQRRYSWEKKHCEKLLEDIMNIGESDKPSHFMGSIVFRSRRRRITTLSIIDGQQRITTMTMLFAALVDYLKKNPQDAERIDVDDADAVAYDFLINANKRGDQWFKLVLTEDDDPIYRNIIKSLVNGDELRLSSDDSRSRMYKSFKFYSENIKEDNVHSIWKGINKLMIVTLDLTDAESPQAIFESLNSTGLELNKSDLIRNYLLMDLNDDDQREIYRKWHKIESSFENSKESFDDFIKHYLSIKYNNVIKGDIYENFKKFTEEKAEEEQFNDNFELIEDLVDDVKKYWEYFKQVVFLEEGKRKLRRSFETLNQLPYTTVRPLILRLYEDYANHELDPEEFIEIINYTESYMLRRTIGGRDSDTVKGSFPKIYELLDKANYLESYQYFLLSKGGQSKFPTDQEFYEAFISRELYNARNIRKYVLLKLTNFNETNERTHIEDVNIEHIMPQNANLSLDWQEELGDDWQDVHKEYLHRVGNLTLTANNSRLSDKTFMEKRTMPGGFDGSHIHLNEYFKDNDIEHWNKEEIIKRADFLFDKAKQIWKYPTLSPETIERYRDQPEETTLDDYPQDEPTNNNKRYWTDCQNKIDNHYQGIFTSTQPSIRSDYRLYVQWPRRTWIQLNVNSYTNEVKSQIVFRDKELFNYLYNQKDEIEEGTDLDLFWESLDERASATISVTNIFDLEDDWAWDASIEWQLEIAEKLYNTFSDRIRAFNN